MKKKIANKTVILSMLSALLMCLTLGSCGPKDLKSIVEKANQECPKQSEGFEITSITYENSAVSFVYTFQEDKLPMSAVALMADQLKGVLLKQIVESDLSEVARLCVEENASLNIVIRGDKGSEGTTFAFSSEELKTALGGQ